MRSNKVTLAIVSDPRPALADVDRRWAAVARRERSATFFYAVASTGVYCRPWCPSRRPLRKNVTFYETPIAAELAGFRACKRCRPQDASSQLAEDEALPVVRMCQRLEESFAEPSLNDLAKVAGLSASHAHRTFVRVTGLTPKHFRAAVVRARIQGSLAQSRTVTEAIYGAGFGSSGRFYERVARMLGMSPHLYRRGAPGMQIRYTVGRCSLGSVLVAATERGVCAVLLGDESPALVRDLESRFPEAELLRPRRKQGDFDRMVKSVIEAVDGRPGSAADALPLDTRGTVFQERVWRALLDVPSGQTTTYGELARAIGSKAAIRAVARACAENRLAVVVPCHRVVRKGGALAGYRWGLERKRELLRREANMRADAKAPAVAKRPARRIRTAEARSGRRR